jgi:glycosyltransferase involved in cell wall biosynthesis
MLEAMGCGVPVITSNTSSMPEVASDAAHIINPYNPEEITQAIIKILGDADYYESLCKKGIERNKLFSWKKMAEQVLLLYNEIKTQHYD